MKPDGVSVEAVKALGGGNRCLVSARRHGSGDRLVKDLRHYVADGPRLFDQARG
jgi:hypothetical protein